MDEDVMLKVEGKDLHSSLHWNRRGRAYWNRLSWLLAGPVCWLLLSRLLQPSETLSPESIKVAAIASWMIIWWIGAPVPIPVTSLLPMCLFPLTGFSSLAQAASGYSNRIIYLFLGGFMMAAAIERHDMHRRLAWGVLLLLGSNPRRMLLGFMVSVGFLSMWLSNTATTVMMLPIALAVIGQLPSLLATSMSEEEANKVSKRISVALLLGIAYAASIGGMATLIGTPPNAVLAGAMREQFQIELSFSRWMLVGVPVSVVGITASYFFLVIFHKLPAIKTPGIQKIIAEKFYSLGKITPNQILVTAVFALAAFSWITRKALLQPIFPKIDDAAIAMIGAVLMFVIPQYNKDRKTLRFLLDWKDMLHIPWGVLLLFGGGFALAGAFSSSGLSLWMGSQLSSLEGASLTVLLLAVIASMCLLTEVTSNTASATIMMPIMGAIAMAIKVEPLLLMASAALSASCAFMLPVATPPNAIVFGSDKLTVNQMVRSGVWINLFFVLILLIAARFLMRVLF